MKTTAQLRATRSDPPGAAARDAERREVYSAALQQSEDLFDAAEAVSAFARPLPLYYAVSQAGRAIAAAWLDEGWRARGHGLAEDTDWSKWQDKGVLAFRVKPTAPGVFTAVADAVRSARLGGAVEMGPAWAALPSIASPVGPWLSAFRVVPEGDLDGPTFLHLGAEHRGVLILPDGYSREIDAVNELLTHFPAAAGARVQVIQGIVAERWTRFGKGIPLQWPTPEVPREPTPEYWATFVRNRVPPYRYWGEHWLVPTLGEAADELPPLMVWWVLLFGFSLLARYEPVAWRRALDPDHSGIAVLLENLFDEALDELPRLLAEALNRRQILGPSPA